MRDGSFYEQDEAIYSPVVSQMSSHRPVIPDGLVSPEIRPVTPANEQFTPDIQDVMQQYRLEMQQYRLEMQQYRLEQQTPSFATPSRVVRAPPLPVEPESHDHIWSLAPIIGLPIPGNPSYVGCVQPDNATLRASIDTLGKSPLKKDGSNWYDFIKLAIFAIKNSGTSPLVLLPVSTTTELLAAYGNDAVLVSLHTRWHSTITQLAASAYGAGITETVYACLEQVRTHYAPEAATLRAKLDAKLYQLQCASWSVADIKKLIVSMQEIFDEAQQGGRDMDKDTQGMQQHFFQALPKTEMSVSFYHSAKAKDFPDMWSFFRYVESNAVATALIIGSRPVHANVVQRTYQAPVEVEGKGWRHMNGLFCEDNGHSVQECHHNAKGTNFKKTGSKFLSRYPAAVLPRVSPVESLGSCSKVINLIQRK